ncbi:FbpB family small basic protein [Oceanobacillus sp. Castelsardo]|nr:FbpB family small basic protein [Oceanobacillus sp. Castelsardo]
MSRLMSSYDELVDKYKMELLNNEQLMDQFEERFEERLAAKSKEIEKE